MCHLLFNEHEAINAHYLNDRVPWLHTVICPLTGHFSGAVRTLGFIRSPMTLYLTGLKIPGGFSSGEEQ